MRLSKISFAAMPLCVGGFFVSVQPAAAACTSSADSLTLNCSGTLSSAITLYDPAAAYQPTAGSNSYTPANPAFPAATNPDNPGYDPNPPTLTVNIDNTTVFNVTTNSTTPLADKGLIVAQLLERRESGRQQCDPQQRGLAQPHHLADRDEPHGGDCRRQSGEQFHRQQFRHDCDHAELFLQLQQSQSVGDVERLAGDLHRQIQRRHFERHGGAL